MAAKIIELTGGLPTEQGAKPPSTRMMDGVLPRHKIAEPTKWELGKITYQNRLEVSNNLGPTALVVKPRGRDFPRLWM